MHQFRVCVNPIDRLIRDMPVDAVITKPSMQVHLPTFIITAEHTSKTILKRHDRAIKDAIR
jgi:hypothetical protein